MVIKWKTRFVCCAMLFVASVAFPQNGKRPQERQAPQAFEKWRCERMPVFGIPRVFGVCDLVCAGLVTSTNDGLSANLAIDDIAWGHAASSNITIRSVAERKKLDLCPGHRYMVCAFTNNWWHASGSWFEDPVYLNKYLSPTSLPPDRVFFDDYRIPLVDFAVVDFKYIDYDGTNYWGGLRSFITNFTYTARVLQDKDVADEVVRGVFVDKSRERALPMLFRALLSFYLDDLDKSK